MNKKQKEILSGFFADIAKAVAIGYGVNAMIGKTSILELVLGFAIGGTFLLISILIFKEATND
jgi:hypothetical protein